MPGDTGLDTKGFISFFDTDAIQQIDAQKCTLMSDAYGVVLQFVLGAVALSFLLIKWSREQQRRSTVVFMKDTTKMTGGAVLGHFVNVYFSASLATAVFTNECAFYLGNFIIDCLACTLCAWLLLRLSQLIAQDCFGSNIFDHGHYREGEEMSTYVIQLVHWLLIIAATKVLLMFSIFLPLKTPIYNICLVLLQPVLNYPRVELFIVMIGLPLILNILVFWVQDTILKHVALEEASAVEGSGKMWAKDVDYDADDQSGTSKQAYVPRKRVRSDGLAADEEDWSHGMDDAELYLDADAKAAERLALQFEEEVRVEGPGAMLAL